MAAMDRHPQMTRAAGLDRLAAFSSDAGHAYGLGRNTDFGPDAKGATSALSPFLRRRLLTEREVVAAALAARGPVEADRFVQEVFWRSYFKGHLETRPALWTNYEALVCQGQARLATESGLCRVHEDAVAGRTGIDGFDDWARELAERNWLHNHARMWFASIWIFTLRLPWALGAAFFMRHLLDGDPASNTPSWRWVAGLHTRGKPYAARAENIRRFTDGRFDPRGLDEDPVALEEPREVAATPLPPAGPAPAGEVALLLHLDDLHPESLDLGQARVARVAGLLAHADGAVPRVRAADREAMADALARAAARFGCAPGPMMAAPGVAATPGPDSPAATGVAAEDSAEAGHAATGPVAWAEATWTEDWAGGLPAVAAWAPVGPGASALPPCVRVRRTWDSLSWSRATKGFFQVKAAIPQILAAEGLADSAAGAHGRRPHANGP